MNQKLLLVGCGKMGSALLTGWLGRDIDDTDVIVVEPSGGKFLQKRFQDVPATMLILTPLDFGFRFRPDGIVIPK